MRLPLLGPVLWAMGPVDLHRRSARSGVAPRTPVPDVLVEDILATSHREFVGSTRAIEAHLAARSLYDALARCRSR